MLESSAFRREYGGEDVIESTRAAVPAWTPEREARLVRAIDRPAFFDGYSALDLGFSPDPHFYLLGWHHVAANAIVFEHELELHGKTVSELAAAIKALELEVWGSDRYDGTMLALATEVSELPEFLARKVHRDAPRQPFLRVGDDNALVLAELASEHGLAVMPTRKDEKALAVDAFNSLVAQERVFVHPRCRRLIEQLRSTVWNVARTGWERTPRDHGDGIDCCVYFARNVRWSRDCRPKTNPLAPFIEREKPAAGGWGKAFGGK